MRMYSLTVLSVALLACGEVADAPMMGAGGSGGGMTRYRDSGTRQPDVRNPRDTMDMGVRDMGGGAGGTSGDPELSFNPDEYVPYGTCPQEIKFVGQIQGASSEVPNGGTPRLTPYPVEYDSGLQGLMTFIPDADGRDDPDPVNVDIQITAATVVATRSATNGNISESQGRFWVADSRGYIEVYLDLNAASIPDFDVRVGSVISMTVTQVGRYGGRPQIRAATNWSALSDAPHPELTAAPAAEVHLLTPDRRLTLNDVNRMIRVTGLTEGEAMSCGSQYTCYQINYGSGTITLRTRDGDLREGTCVTFAGPLSAFRDNLQLESFNPLWARRYQKGAAMGEACMEDSECTTQRCVTLGEEKLCSLDCDENSDCPAGFTCQFNTTCLPRQGSECPDEITFTGQLSSAEAERPNGGRARFTPYPDDYDAGLRRLIAALPATTVDGDPEPIVVDMPIQKATVVATRSFTEDDVPESQRGFWVADANGVVEVYLDAGARGGTPNFIVKSGSVISFRATRIGRYQRKSQISAGTDWVLHGPDEPPHAELPATPDAEVPVWTPDRELTQADSHRMIRITSQLDGPPRTCGSGNTCWTIDYGFGDPVTIRTSHPDAATGQCVTFVGPVGFYRGNLQFDTTNLDWLRVYN